MGRISRKKGEPMENGCALRITHLLLNSLRLDGGLEHVVRWCPNLRALYAYDNRLTRAFVSHKLELAFLQENLLSDLEFLETAQGLKYINVSDNCIPTLTWTVAPPKDPSQGLVLEKLNISRQHTQYPLVFDLHWFSCGTSRFIFCLSILPKSGVTEWGDNICKQ